MNGILIINKSAGMTSFDVVAKLRKILEIKKIGHGGTLDPMATGVLPIFIGKATKIINIIQDQDKEYIASFELGIQTDTQDITGSVIKKKESFESVDNIKNILNNFTGQINQVPPMFSAIKINGKRLYDLARQGKEIQRDARKINIYNISLLSFDPKSQTGSIKTKVSKGTYIRTLINDIGIQLGCGATMTSLVRTKALNFDIKNSYSLDEIKKLKQEKKINNILLNSEQALKSLPEIFLENDIINKLSNGVKIKVNTPVFLYYRVYNKSGVFLGIGYTKQDSFFKLKNIKIMHRSVK